MFKISSLIPSIHLAAIASIAVACSVKASSIASPVFKASSGEIADYLLSLSFILLNLGSRRIEEVDIIYLHVLEGERVLSDWIGWDSTLEGP